jgi:DNA-binding NarL/FixJ family response regulator
VLRILLADDHRLLRETLRAGLTEAGEEVVGEATNGREAVSLAVDLRPDVVLIDLSMPVLDGIEATRQITSTTSECAVVALTMHPDAEHKRRAFEAGAVACLSKDSSLTEVIETVRAMAGQRATSEPGGPAGRRRSEAGLSPRQLEILQLMAAGQSTKETARTLGLTQKTIHNQINAIKKVLGVPSATHAVVEAVRRGLVDLD